MLDNRWPVCLILAVAGCCVQCIAIWPVFCLPSDNTAPKSEDGIENLAVQEREMWQ